MATMDIMSIVMFVLRMAPAILFVLFMMLLFFSFRVELKEDSMSRFTTELADSLSSSELTTHRSVFDPEKLSQVENVEVYAQNCDFGYSIDVQSLAGGNQNWKHGYTPPSNSIIKQARSEFPIGLSAADTVIPAKLFITAYDSVLTRLSCLTKKAYELKKLQQISMDRVYGAVFRRTDPQGTHVCLYNVEDRPVDCRYFPGINFEPFEILRSQFEEGVVEAYPVKVPANCNEIKSNPSVIAGANDVVVTVVLCVAE